VRRQTTPVTKSGIRAADLARRASRSGIVPVSGAELTRWLVSKGFAVRRDDGTLEATPSGLEVAAGID
jgi:hypothetical protein